MPIGLLQVGAHGEVHAAPKVAFATRFVLSYTERLQQENVAIKNTDKIVQQLGLQRAMEYIQADLTLGMVVYFTPSYPYFLQEPTDILYL